MTIKKSVKRMSRPSKQLSIAVGESLVRRFWAIRLVLLADKFPARNQVGV